MNEVIKGAFTGYSVVACPFTKAIFLMGEFNFEISKYTIEKYEVIETQSRKSTSSAILRGSIGVALLGAAGILAAITAKKKNSHLIAIQFNSTYRNRKSLLEVNDKIYKYLITSLF